MNSPRDLRTPELQSRPHPNIQSLKVKAMDRASQIFSITRPRSGGSEKYTACSARLFSWSILFRACLFERSSAIEIFLRRGNTDFMLIRKSRAFNRVPFVAQDSELRYLPLQRLKSSRFRSRSNLSVRLELAICRLFYRSDEKRQVPISSGTKLTNWIGFKREDSAVAMAGNAAHES